MRLQEWSRQIKEREASGLSVREWCAGRGLCPKTYYTRLKRVREELLETASTQNGLVTAAPPDFALLPTPSSNRSDIVVHAGAITVELNNVNDSHTIKSVIEALRC
jgi:hypothetical protein